MVIGAAISNTPFTYSAVSFSTITPSAIARSGNPVDAVGRVI
jgi:hypothetical protein